MAMNQLEMRNLLHAIRRTSNPADRGLLMTTLEAEIEPVVAKLPQPKPEVSVAEPVKPVAPKPDPDPVATAVAEKIKKEFQAKKAKKAPAKKK